MLFKKKNIVALVVASFVAGPIMAQSPEAPSGGAGTALDQILDNQGGPTALDQQDVDPNQIVSDLLRINSTQGPEFVVSPERVFMEFVEGGQSNVAVRIQNVGDLDGKIEGINELAPLEGLLVTNTCLDGDGTLPVGQFCDISVSYTSDDPSTILSAILITMNERGRSNITVPIQINVTPEPFNQDEQPVEPEPEPEPEPNPEPIRIDPNDPRFQPKGPTSEDIARQYFAGLGGIAPPQSGPMAVVSLPDRLRPVEEEKFLDGSDSLLSVETISMDPRYPDSIASTEATLPVDRSKILTSDRVIKAVLDTPFSNVMCGKVVAVVESDVYSTTSAVPLVQAGSRVIGRCGELVQERAGIVWERIITVDGRSISLDGEDSMTRDASGLGGALGRVYRTPFDRYILPIFGTFVDVGAGFVQAEYGEDEEQSVTEDGTIVQSNSARNEGIRTATEAVQTRAQETIREMQDVREVLVVPAGSRIDIEIFEDIYFKDERDVVRIADTVYDVSRPEQIEASIASPDNITLIPYRAGIEGPTVMVNGRRFVVQEGSATPVSLDDNGQPIAGDENPGSSRPGADTPSSPGRPDTQATLDDLR